MKLILASDLSFLLKYGYNLTGIPKDQMKIGYIITASKVARTDFNQKVKNSILESGYNIFEFDIENKTENEIRIFFADKNIIHIEGGNSFYLLKAVRESGFAPILKSLLEEGKVYIGTSAGAYLMCPSIEVSDWTNDDTVTRCGLTDFTALGYVPFILKVHYKDENKELLEEKIKTSKYPLRILRDGQGVLVEDDACTFFGDGEEVIIK